MTDGLWVGPGEGHVDLQEGVVVLAPLHPPRVLVAHRQEAPIGTVTLTRLADEPALLCQPPPPMVQPDCLGGEMVGLARKSLFGAAALAALFACSTAIAAPVTASDPDTVVAALQNSGYKAKLTTDKDGDAWVETASEGNDIRIAFLSCNNKKSCTQLEFLAFWDCDKEVKRCETLSNTWNSEEVFSHTIMIENKIAMYRHLLLDEGGASEALFIKNFEFFSRDAAGLMDKF